MNVLARDIRAKLMNPPVKITREQVMDLQQRNRNLAAKIIMLEEANKAKQEVIDTLLTDLRSERDFTKSLELRMRAMDEDESGSVDDKPSIKSIVREELKDWPGVTWAQVKGGRKPWHVVQARRQCLQAVYQKRPDLTLQEIGRIFNKDHSTVCYAVYQGNQVLKKMELNRQRKAAERGEV